MATIHNGRLAGRGQRILVFLLTLFVLGACVGSPKPLDHKKESVVDTDTFSFDVKEYPTNEELLPTYHINSGDLLDILFQISTNQSVDNFKLSIDHQVTVKFINNPELNETQRVQPDGMIVLPYVGRIHVVGKTIDGLVSELRGKYSKIFKDPELYVLVPEFSTAIKELKADLHTAPRGLSRLVTVRPDGFATFPLIGDVFVATKTVPQANKDIDRKYEEKMPGLHVDLFVEKASGSRVYVMGQVRTAGAYPVEKPISVFEAITFAGGHTDTARLDNVVVMRRKDKKVYIRRINLISMIEAQKDSEYFYLRPEDLVYVPRTTIASLAQVMTELAEIIWFRGWSVNVDLLSSGIIDNQPVNSSTNQQTTP